MILRRVIEHFRKQEWKAIFLDFVIVVTGVFVGLQVNNWNEARTEHRRLVAALASLEAETQTNLEIIDAMIAKIGKGIDLAEAARPAIETCADDAPSRSAVETAIGYLTRDFAPTFVSAATQNLGARDDLFDHLSADFRKAFWRYQGRLFEEDAQLQTNFELIWGNHVSRYKGLDADLSRDIRKFIDGLPIITLPPMSSLCADPEFRYRFMETAQSVDAISRRLTSLREEVVLFRAALDSARAL